MLTKVRRRAGRKTGGRFAIVASTYNARYVDALLRSASAELRRGGAEEIQVVRVPGAFEIPAVAARLAESGAGRWSAILCLGVVLQGETRHAVQIGNAVSHALALLQVQFRSPFLHGVYLFENEEQARVRCLGRKHNRGLELARTALEMARVMMRL